MAVDGNVVFIAPFHQGIGALEAPEILRRMNRGGLEIILRCYDIEILFDQLEFLIREASRHVGRRADEKMSLVRVLDRCTMLIDQRRDSRGGLSLDKPRAK